MFGMNASGYACGCQYAEVMRLDKPLDRKGLHKVLDIGSTGA